MAASTPHLRLAAVGDICPGDKAILGLGICTLSQRHGPDPFFAGVKDHLADADLAVCNLEGFLRAAASHGRPDIPFAGVPAMAAAIRDAGFHVVNLANNHVLDHDEASFTETVSHLRDAGLEVIGLRDPDGPYHCRPVIIERGGVTVGLLAYNWVGRARFDRAEPHIAQSPDTVVNYTWNRTPDEDRERRQRVADLNQRIHADLRRLRPEVDVLVLATHWGYEFVHRPPLGVVLEGRSFIDSGCDVILGGHPHVLQGWERHAGGVILYSLGNFVFDTEEAPRRDSVIAQVTVGAAEPPGVSFQPVLIDDGYRPQPATGADAERILGLIEQSSRQIAGAGTDASLDDDRVYREYEAAYTVGKRRLIRRHFRLAARHHFVRMLILRKMWRFLGLVGQRLRGKKTRW